MNLKSSHLRALRVETIFVAQVCMCFIFIHLFLFHLQYSQYTLLSMGPVS